MRKKISFSKLFEPLTDSQKTTNQPVNTILHDIPQSENRHNQPAQGIELVDNHVVNVNHVHDDVSLIAHVNDSNLEAYVSSQSLY